MSVFLYTAPSSPPWGCIMMPSERLRLLQWLGILLAFAGIALAFAGGVSFEQLDGRMLLGDALAIGGLAWGATTVVVRCSRLSEAPATLTLFYQLAVGFRRAAADGPGERADRRFRVDPAGGGQRAVPGHRGVVRQLPDLVLVAAQVPGFEPGGVLPSSRRCLG
jgi:hypothetical protein